MFDPGAVQAGHVAVTLPHDAMLAAGPAPDGDPALAYHRTGTYQYAKAFTPPAAWAGRSVAVRFEGVGLRGELPRRPVQDLPRPRPRRRAPDRTG
jgi:hypothetical protein